MKKVIFILALVFSIPAFSQENEGFIINVDSKIHYKTYGAGDPILIINGGPGMSSEGFGYLAKKLANLGFQTITYDQRGTGLSSVKTIDTEHITMKLMVEDIEKLRTQFKIKKWIVLGHSFGGMLATQYAAKHPESIEKLILSSSGGVNMDFTHYVQSRINDKLTKIQKDSLNYFQRKMDQGDASESTKQLRANYLAYAYTYNKIKAPVLAKRLSKVDFRINSLVFQDLRRNFNFGDKFSDFKQPVLVLQGENDIISIDTAKETAKTFPNSELVLLKNCGHYGWIDAEDAYFTAIERFLKS